MVGMGDDGLELSLWCRIGAIYASYEQWQNLRLGGPHTANREGWKGEWVRVSKDLTGRMMQLLREGLSTPESVSTASGK